MCLMSLAGGTGSGMGTFVTEMLRDEYPRRFILNQVVMPYQTGEVIVQSYNALLTLSHLYQVWILTSNIVSLLVDIYHMSRTV